MTPEEAFYERLLDDSDDATEQAEEFAKERSFVEFFDAIAIPALVRMQADKDRGAISADRCAKVRQGIKAMLENIFDNTIEEAVPEYPARSKVELMPVIDCMPGRNGLDAAAALLLAYLLRLEGRVRRHQLRFADVPLSDVVYPRLFEQPGLVFVSLISTSAPARVRYLVQRIRWRAPGVNVLIGLWGIATGRARGRESGAWRPGRRRHELTRCSWRGACSCPQIGEWPFPDSVRPSRSERGAATG